ncbi:MAG: protein translocase subunit SecF [Melioribacteraceae bacterium]|nr:protein translocase subunit SecF [Melioribacteraceae bacterium]MCF8411844.1 protein translocase subunit SecF [Melioribacteraceae bacterium]MCF8431801.1 protein translocase subunit SecF [Melioribacteraceae bacterium]
MRIFEKLNIDFLSKRKTAYIISGVLILAGIISLAVRGLELGIDFKGGTEVALKFEKPIDISAARDKINTLGLGNVEVKTFGGDEGILVRTELQEIPANVYSQVVAATGREINKYYPDIDLIIVDSAINYVTYDFQSAEIANDLSDRLFEEGLQTSKVSEEPENTQLIVRIGIADWIEENLKEEYSDNPFVVQKSSRVGPKIGNELKTDAIIAVVLALIGILVYLGFRFKFVFAVGAVAALFHDVLITLGVFSLFYGLIPGLNLEISIYVVSSFLTLVGYSINDTVVVFDRVRENLKIHKTAKLEDNINSAINKTMPRTIITSATTLFVVTVLLFAGGEVLRGFAFTLFLGIIVGTYSSVFVASPFVLEYVKKSKKKLEF